MALFAFDVDGTLLDEKTSAHAPETVQHIQALRNAGHQVAVITGRFFLDQGFLDLMRPDAWALGNGNQIWAGGKEVVRHHLTAEEVQQLLALVPPETSVVGSDVQDVPLHYVSRYQHPTWEGWLGSLHKEPLENAVGKPLLQLQFKGGRVPELRAQARQRFPHLNFAGGMPPYPKYLNVTARQANKAHALREIAGLLDMPLSQVVAFGDSDNDIDMLKIAGHAVQVGDMPYLRDICKEQVSCPLQGLPDWLERFLSGEVLA